jgi:hypothetical protein
MNALDSRGSAITVSVCGGLCGVVTTKKSLGLTLRALALLSRPSQ